MAGDGDESPYAARRKGQGDDRPDFAAAEAQSPCQNHTGNSTHRGRGVQGPLVRTAEDEVVGVEERRNTDAEANQSTPQRGLEYDGSGEQEAQSGEEQSADTQAIVHCLPGRRGGRYQKGGKVQQNQDPADDPAAQTCACSFAVDRGEQHHEQA